MSEEIKNNGHNKAEPMNMRINDVCALTGIQKTTLYKLVKLKKLPYYRFDKIIRFRKSEILKWLEGQKMV